MPQTKRPVSVSSQLLSSAHSLQCGIDVAELDTRLQQIEDNPRTPILSPINNIPMKTNSSEVCRDNLLNRGLSFIEVDLARKWDQKPLHRTAELIHMELLVECAKSLPKSGALYDVLRREYQSKMVRYRRRQNASDSLSSAVSYVQRTATSLVAEMTSREFSADEIVKIREATSILRSAVELVTDSCEIKLAELKRTTRKRKRNMSQDSTTLPRRSSERIRKNQSRRYHPYS